MKTFLSTILLSSAAALTATHAQTQQPQQQSPQQQSQTQQQPQRQQAQPSQQGQQSGQQASPQSGQNQTSSQQGQQQQAQGDPCARLVNILQRNPRVDSPVTSNQARDYQQQGNRTACEQALNRVLAQAPELERTQAEADRSRIVVQRTAPGVFVDQAAPNIRVRQPQPQVSVRQQQPQIIVRQSPPTITVQQNPPEITVRMPEPEVNVTMAQPQVSVQMPRPDVQMVAPEGEPRVQVQPAQPQVFVDRAERVTPTIQRIGRADVRFEQTGEPQVVYQRSQQQPQIRFEQVEQQDRQQDALASRQQQNQEQIQDQERFEEQQAMRQQQLDRRRQADARQQQAMQSMAATDLRGMIVYDARGERVGDVERIVAGPNNRQYLVVAYGGLFGFGEREVAIPLQNAQVSGDRILLQNMTQDQVDDMPGWSDADGYRDLQRARIETAQ